MAPFNGSFFMAFLHERSNTFIMHPCFLIVAMFWANSFSLPRLSRQTTITLFLNYVLLLRKNDTRKIFPESFKRKFWGVIWIKLKTMKKKYLWTVSTHFNIKLKLSKLLNMNVSKRIIKRCYFRIFFTLLYLT